MTKLAIVGPGLLGGSIALATHRHSGTELAIWARREDVVKEIRERQLADLASTDLHAVCSGADLIVLCIPIGAMPALARQIVPVVGPETLITDVGSVKAQVVDELGSIFAGKARFVGSHPMAGSEQTGMDAARADLFRDAVCIVTPGPGSDPRAVAEIDAFWTGLGCRVRELGPVEHDEIVSLISHLPHLLAAALVNAVVSTNASALDFCGPGFRDTTRVAGGPPAMWAEILKMNRSAVRASAEAVIAKLRECIILLDRESPDSDTRMMEFLTEARNHREKLRFPR